MKLKDSILRQITDGKFARKTEKDILVSAFRTSKARKEARAAIRELLADGSVIADNRGRLCTPAQAGAFMGTVQANPRGFAFIIADDKAYGKDFFVPHSSLNGAYDGDRVLAAPVRDAGDEAYIIKICERGKKRFVGTFENRGRFAFVTPDDGRLPEADVPLPLAVNAKSGDKVVCEITRYGKNAAPTAKICEILGESGDFEAEELSVIRSYGLYEEFSDFVESQAEQAAGDPIIPGNRRDLRGTLIFTVDGADTRDIDDAISLEMREGEYVLGVHIADVSRYVNLHSAIDDEAYARGTSVYFPDKVLPMLPRALSNGACSLNEGEDRYALSCVMTFGKDGVRRNYEIFESIICSRHKMTYPDVLAICENDAKMCEKYSDITETVWHMRDLCLILEQKRQRDGEISLDVKEAKIYIGDDGDIIIPDYERTVSERMIEQFMIAANEAVAEFLTEKQAPCLYRVHETPSPEKAEILAQFLKDLGITAHLNADRVSPKDFQNILSAVADKPYATVVNKVMLRSMQKARYCEKNLGHFGLASECYCHFTSPIRRYPDLFVHRAVKEVLHGGNKLELYSENAHTAGIRCSERERIADEAERSVDNLYKLVYMEDRTGEIFDAIVSGVTDFGVFCELKNTVEGLIPIECLPDDGYEYIAEKFLLKGAKHSYRLGDAIRVRADGCDYGRMRVMFSPVK